jgi:hypothetical protein
MQLTFLGIFIIVLLIYFALANKINILYNPYIYALLLYLKNFGYHDSVTNISLKTEMVILVSFVIYSICFYISFTKKRSYLFLYKNYKYIIKKTEILPLRRQKLMIFGILIYAIINLIFFSYVYGGLNNALIRFYAIRPVNEVPVFMSSIITFFYMFCVYIVCILSVDYSLYNKKGYVYILISSFICAFIAFSKGTRGAVTGIPLMIIIGVTLGSLYKKKSILKSLFSPRIVLLVLIGLYLALVLTNIRSIKFNDPVEAWGSVSNLKNAVLSKGLSETGEGVLDITNSVVNKFGDEFEYLEDFYTIKAILVNPIPRIFWKEKPVGVGRILAEVQSGYTNYTPSYLIEEYIASFAVGIAGEGWMQGGWIALCYLSVIFGLISGWMANLAKFCFRSKNYFFIVIGIMAFQAVALFVRGDMLSGFTQSMYPIILFFIIAFLVNNLLKSLQR